MTAAKCGRLLNTKIGTGKELIVAANKFKERIKQSRWEMFPDLLFDHDLASLLAKFTPKRQRLQAYSTQIKSAYFILVNIADKVGSKGNNPAQIKIGFTHKQLAALWNISTETAKRLTADLRAVGVLSWRPQKWKKKRIYRSKGEWTIQTWHQKNLFTKVPQSAVFDRQLSLEAKFLYFYFVNLGIMISGQLHKYKGMEDLYHSPIIFTSEHDLFTRFGFHTKMVNRKLDELKKNKWINWVGPSPRGSRYIKILPEPRKPEPINKVMLRIGASLPFKLRPKKRQEGVKKDDTISGYPKQGDT